MKTYQKLATIAITAATCTVGARAGEGMDAAAIFRGVAPGRGADWEGAIGAEGQLRFWATPRRGVALTAGIQSWQAPDEFDEWEEAGEYYSSWIGGNTTLVPLGVSFLYRRELMPPLSLSLETGVRYVLVDSSISVEAVADNGVAITEVSDTIETENTFLVVLGLNLEARIVEGMNLSIGLGYQLDMTEPHESLLGEDLGATSFGGMTASMGVVWAF